MSKKNKRRSQEKNNNEIHYEKPENPEQRPEDSLKSEFTHLSGAISVILVLLAGLYYYDRQSGILEKLAEKLLNS